MVLAEKLSFSADLDERFFLELPAGAAVFVFRGDGEPYVSKTANLRKRLQRLLGPSKATGRVRGLGGLTLSECFHDSLQVLRRLRVYAADLVAKDSALFPAASAAKLIHMHVDAACRSASDLNEYLIGKRPTLFDDHNIWVHLRFPHHCYVSFFLDRVSAADGVAVVAMQGQIVKGLEICTRLLHSQRPSDLRSAQHALHLLARYRDEPTTRQLKSANPETRRMGYFGNAYRLFDDGPYEEISKLITNDAAFGRATFEFDLLHYRDSCGRSAVACPATPIKSMTRMLGSLADPRASIRRLSAARIRNTLTRLDPRVLQSPAFSEQLASKRSAIEGFSPDGALETGLHHDLLKRIRS